MNDSELIKQIKAGNIELYSELMGRYERKIYAFVYHMLRSSGLELMTEDLVSETFYKAYRSLDSFREIDASFSTWVYTIARNTVLSELRKHRGSNIPLEESGDLPIASVDTAPEQAMLRSESVIKVREAINNLPEKQRIALILREYDQMGYQEISDVLGQTVSSVKSLLFRARISVKNQLHSYFFEPIYEEYEGMKNQ